MIEGPVGEGLLAMAPLFSGLHGQKKEGQKASRRQAEGKQKASRREAEGKEKARRRQAEGKQKASRRQAEESNCRGAGEHLLRDAEMFTEIWGIIVKLLTK